MNASMSHPERLNQAAEWLQRLQGAPRDETLVAQWADWCQADPQNLMAFERIEAVWNALDAPELSSSGLRTERAAFRLRLASRVSRLSLALAASLLLAIGVAFVAWRYGGHDTDPNTYQTQAAQVRTYALQDGTQLTLGPDSYAFARHTPAVREVVLIQGQVFVRVAKDPTRPFRVLAADKAITALGTAFDARLDGNVLKVAVTEGKVSIAAAARGPAPVLLGAGEQTVARIDGPIAAPSLSKTKDPTAWRKGQLQYIDEALADVIADVNRYTSEKIVLTQPQLRDRLYTGTVYRDRIDEWVKALEEVFPLQAQKREGRILLQQKEP